MKITEIFESSIKYSLNVKAIFWASLLNYSAAGIYWGIISGLFGISFQADLIKFDSFFSGTNLLQNVSILFSILTILPVILSSFYICVISDKFSKFFIDAKKSSTKLNYLTMIKRYFSVLLTNLIILLVLIIPFLLVQLSVYLISYFRVSWFVPLFLLQILWIILSFLAPIIAWLEKVNPFEAIKKSISIVSKNKVETVKFLVTYHILVGFIVIAYFIVNMFLPYWIVFELFKSFTILFTFVSWTFYYVDKKVGLRVDKRLKQWTYKTMASSNLIGAKSHKKRKVKRTRKLARSRV